MHFTYQDAPFHPDLMQGDVLGRTPKIEAILQQVHPHYYQKVDNKYFIVLTQDCDLVRRHGQPCDTRYISVAPVRPLRVALNRYIDELSEEGFESETPVCTMNSQGRFRNFLERLLNNNEPTYFYLRSEPGRGFPEDCCALLALSIPIKAHIHYDSCVEAKLLELAEGFRAKLGWLAGQMFSRVGTEDWPEDELRAQIKEIVESSSFWVESRKLKELEKQVNAWKAANPGAVLSKTVIAELAHRIPKRKDLVADQILKVLRNSGLVGQADETRVKNLVRNDSIVSTLIPD